MDVWVPQKGFVELLVFLDGGQEVLVSISGELSSVCILKWGLSLTDWGQGCVGPHKLGLGGVWTIDVKLRGNNDT